jgi:hypothetical protein
VKGAEVKINVSAKVRIATTEEIVRADLIIRVFRRFKVRIRSSGKS